MKQEVRDFERRKSICELRMFSAYICNNSIFLQENPEKY